VSEINKGTKKSIIPKFELSYFSSDFDAFFLQKYHLYGLLMNHKNFGVLFQKEVNIQNFGISTPFLTGPQI
jgi:hypothetical protein